MKSESSEGISSEVRGVQLVHRFESTRPMFLGMEVYGFGVESTALHEYVLLFSSPSEFRVPTTCYASSGVELAVDETSTRYGVQCESRWTIYFRASEDSVFKTDAPEGFDGTDASWTTVPSVVLKAEELWRNGPRDVGVLDGLRDNKSFDERVEMFANTCREAPEQDWSMLRWLLRDEAKALGETLERSRTPDTDPCLRVLADGF